MGFAETLRSGKFIVTAEISPPKGVDVSRQLLEAGLLSGLVDAVNVTDNQRAVMRMAPIALCHQLIDLGFEVIMHMTGRDRNRLALQSDLLAAHALGVRNILAMSGDFTTLGDHKGARPVYDLDSVQLLQLISKLNSGYDSEGNVLDGQTSFCPGAVANPNSGPELQLFKLHKKVQSGARFIQTQAVFDTAAFIEFAEGIKHTGIPVIAGIMPLRSHRNASFINEKIPGIRIPQDIMARMEHAPDPVTEGLEIAVETINAIRRSCSGIHIMPVGGHENTRLLLEMNGLTKN